MLLFLFEMARLEAAQRPRGPGVASGAAAAPAQPLPAAAAAARAHGGVPRRRGGAAARLLGSGQSPCRGGSPAAFEAGSPPGGRCALRYGGPRRQAGSVYYALGGRRVPLVQPGTASHLRE
ncbi:unnamed protein product, partial [Prorocentrum cordatum]